MKNISDLSKSQEKCECSEMFLNLFSLTKGHVVTRNQRKYHKANNCPFNKILEVVKIPKIILNFKR